MAKWKFNLLISFLYRLWFPLVATLVVLVALGRMPYGYYMLLRLFICAGAIYYLLLTHNKIKLGHRVTLICIVVLYNPILPVHLMSKTIWSLANLVTVVYFWIIAFRYSR